MNKIGIIGTGYVGLVTGLGFAKLGNTVHFIDIDEMKVDNLKKGVAPFFEPGLKEALSDKSILSRVEFTTDYLEGLNDADLVFICVQTPQMNGKVADLSYLFDAIRRVNEVLDEDKIICIKSTFPPSVLSDLEKEFSNYENFIFNPEFLREGSAFYDFSNPDRIIIGGLNKDNVNYLSNIYKSFDTQIILTDPVTSQLSKYLSNAYLPMRLSFINEALQIGTSLGADIETLVEAIGADKRIGKDYFRPSPGWGGSCFPKDTKALEFLLKENNLNAPLMNSIHSSNDEHMGWILEKIINLKNEFNKKQVVLLGAAFKENTDDLRESPTLKIYSELKKEKIPVIIIDNLDLDIEDYTTDVDKVNNSLVIVMYPGDNIDLLLGSLMDKENKIIIPWENIAL